MNSLRSLRSLAASSCLALLCSCSTGPQVTEVGSAVGAAYTNPKTGEAYAAKASSYVKLAQKAQADPKQIVAPTYAK